MLESPQFLITADELARRDRELSWRAWLAVLLVGFLCGATAVLLAFWLFAHWMHH